MSQPGEKDAKNEVIIAESGGESSVGLKEASQMGSDGQANTETKKSWKSFFWSSEHPTIECQTQTMTY